MRAGCPAVRFKVDRESELLCSKELNSDELEEFREALAADYYFQARRGAAGRAGGGGWGRWAAQRTASTGNSRSSVSSGGRSGAASCAER